MTGLIETFVNFFRKTEQKAPVYPFYITEIILLKNCLMCDGTPRREKGYRKVVRIEYSGRVVYATSPLFRTEVEANCWWPRLSDYSGEVG